MYQRIGIVPTNVNPAIAQYDYFTALVNTLERDKNLHVLRSVVYNELAANNFNNHTFQAVVDTLARASSGAIVLNPSLVHNPAGMQETINTLANVVATVFMAEKLNVYPNIHHQLGPQVIQAIMAVEQNEGVILDQYLNAASAMPHHQATLPPGYAQPPQQPVHHMQPMQPAAHTAWNTTPAHTPTKSTRASERTFSRRKPARVEENNGANIDHMVRDVDSELSNIPSATFTQAEQEQIENYTPPELVLPETSANVYSHQEKFIADAFNGTLPSGTLVHDGYYLINIRAIQDLIQSEPPTEYRGLIPFIKATYPNGMDKDPSTIVYYIKEKEIMNYSQHETTFKEVPATDVTLIESDDAPKEELPTFIPSYNEIKDNDLEYTVGCPTTSLACRLLVGPVSGDTLERTVVIHRYNVNQVIDLVRDSTQDKLWSGRLKTEQFLEAFADEKGSELLRRGISDRVASELVDLVEGSLSTYFKMDCDVVKFWDDIYGPLVSHFDDEPMEDLIGTIVKRATELKLALSSAYYEDTFNAISKYDAGKVVSLVSAGASVSTQFTADELGIDIADYRQKFEAASDPVAVHEAIYTQLSGAQHPYLIDIVDEVFSAYKSRPINYVGKFTIYTEDNKSITVYRKVGDRNYVARINVD